MNKNIKSITLCSFLLAISLVLSYIELIVGSFLPIQISGIGLKIGISNIVTLILLNFFTIKRAFLIVFLRLLIMMMLFTNIINFGFSFFGFIFSFTIMTILFKIFHLKNIIYISIYGGIMHNIGQLFFALIYIKNFRILFILPILVFVGVLSGLIVGVISNILIKYIEFQKLI